MGRWTPSLSRMTARSPSDEARRSRVRLRLELCLNHTIGGKVAKITGGDAYEHRASGNELQWTPNPAARSHATNTFTGRIRLR